MTKSLLTIERAALESMPTIDLTDLARNRARQIDNLVMPLLKPWQRRLILSPHGSKRYMRPLVWLAKRTAGITIEHHQGSTFFTGDAVRMESRIVVKQHGKIVS